MAWEGSTRNQRLPKDWAKIRAAILKRDRWVCYICKGPNADTVDHVVRGDNHEPSNLAAVHDRNAPHCHRRKSGQEGAAATWAKRAPRKRPPEEHPGAF